MNKDHTAFTGTVPEHYEKYLGPILFEPYAIDLIERIDATNVNSVLEIACGTGRVTKHLRKLFPKQTIITATDLNEAMIETARATIGDEGIIFKAADAQELPFEDESFDMVVIQYGVMFFPEKKKALKEIHRVLKNGGVLWFNTWDKLENNELLNTANSVITKFFNNEPPSFYQTPFSMFDTEEIRKLVEEAGFKNIEITRVKKEGSSPSSDHAVLGIIDGNPIKKEIMDKDPSAVDKIKEEIKREIVKKFGDNPVKTKLNAIVTKGVK